MTKPKPKAYRGVQSYLTEEQIRTLSKNPNIIEVAPRQCPRNDSTTTIPNHKITTDPWIVNP